MKSVRKRLTYANVMSSLAVFLVVAGGSALAATQLGKNTVGTNQLKKNAVTTAKIKNGAVTGAKVNAATLGTVPNATNATNATNAKSADTAKAADTAKTASTATLADTATKAVTAANSEKLGGLGASSFVQQTAQTGEVLTGQISVRYPANAGFIVGAGSYRSPLASGTPVPTLVYTTSTTAQCPGVGQAASSVLCVYGYNVFNIATVSTSGGFSEPNYRFGFSVDISPTTAATAGFFLASWAYRVP